MDHLWMDARDGDRVHQMAVQYGGACRQGRVDRRYIPIKQDRVFAGTDRARIQQLNLGRLERRIRGFDPLCNAVAFQNTE